MKHCDRLTFEKNSLFVSLRITKYTCKLVAFYVSSNLYCLVFDATGDSLGTNGPLRGE